MNITVSIIKTIILVAGVSFLILFGIWLAFRTGVELIDYVLLGEPTGSQWREQ